MTTTSSAGTAPALGVVTLRSEAVEQVMRTCDDDLAVLPFLEVTPGGPEAAAALGRLLSEHPLRLVAGCPLIALVTGGVVDQHWRAAYPARPDSLYAHLEFLSSLYGAPDDLDAYGSLELLRTRSLDDMGGLSSDLDF